MYCSHLPTPSFMQPGSPSQSLPVWGRPEILDTGSGVNRLPLVISPITHIPSGDWYETGVPVSVTPVVSDNTSGFLESVLNWSFPQLMSDTSVISDGTWLSALDSPVKQTPVLCPIQMSDRRLGWDGPNPRIGDSADGCAFRCTTHRISDFARPSAEFGLPLHHPRFLEVQGPDAWFWSLTCTQSIDAARTLHHDVCLVASNLNILDQYVLCLQGTVTKLLE